MIISLLKISVPLEVSLLLNWIMLNTIINWKKRSKVILGQELQRPVWGHDLSFFSEKKLMTIKNSRIGRPTGRPWWRFWEVYRVYIWEKQPILFRLELNGHEWKSIRWWCSDISLPLACASAPTALTPPPKWNLVAPLPGIYYLEIAGMYIFLIHTFYDTPWTSGFWNICNSSRIWSVYWSS